jgi:hypothetical protein
MKVEEAFVFKISIRKDTLVLRSVFSKSLYAVCLYVACLYACSVVISFGPEGHDFGSV